MRKKRIILGLCLIILTGCSNEKTMMCTRTRNQNGIKTSLTYQIQYQENDVKKVHSEEKIETNSEDILKNYQKQVENIYSAYKGIKYYEYSVNIDQNTLISTVDIDYSKIDTKKLIEIDSTNGNIIKNGKIKIQDIKNLYEQLGASCK